MRQPTILPEPFSYSESETFAPRVAGEVTTINRNTPDYLRWVQLSLNRVMGLRLAVDGVLGPATRSAIRSFQQKQGLSVDGIIGPKTEAALRAALASAQVVEQPPRLAPEACPPSGETMRRTVYGWTQYRRQVSELPPDQQAVIAQVGETIRKSYTPGCQPVQSVQVHGHADRDTPRNLTRERQMSDERAQAVSAWLADYVGPAVASQIAWETLGLGATHLKAPATTEENRRQNRRVEISMSARAAPPPGQCAVFLEPIVSPDWTLYRAAPTTGRFIPLINGRDSGGPGPNTDRAEAFDQMQRLVESLQRGDVVYLAAWQFDPGVRLTLSSPLGATTWGGVFQSLARRGIRIRIIMSDFDSLAPFWAQLHTQYLPALDRLIDGLSPAARPNLKYLVSLHPATFLTRTAGSHHQKFMVVKKGAETVAFCGGLDIAFLRTPVYWTGGGLLAWHDIHSRLEGLVARDLEREFVLRWNRERNNSTVTPRPGWGGLELLHQGPVSPIDRAGDRNLHRLQTLRTISVQGPIGTVQHTTRDDIWQMYVRMTGCAHQFLYLENQYFRDLRLADAIAAQARTESQLIVIIVVPARLDEGNDRITQHGNALQRQFFLRLTAALGPNRLRIYTMFRRFIHSKFILVDDVALSVGSANANPRSFQMDTELNVVVREPELVRAFRHRLWAHDLGIPRTTIAAWRVADYIPRWDAVARANVGLTARPDDMTGEGVMPFDINSIQGRRQHIPDVLTEMNG